MRIAFLPMRVGSTRGWVVAAMALAGILVMAPSSNAALMGTTPLTSGSSGFPGLVASGTNAGTLLASLSSPYSYSTNSGTTSGTVNSAVYRETGGTLDFYYQVNNSANSATAINRETDDSFTGFSVATGFRTDGAAITGGGFVNGVEAPVLSDLGLGGSVVGFNFNPPASNAVLKGTSSNVLIISTNATAFRSGDASVIDGGTQTVAAFQPTSGVPEPGTMLLMGAGMIALAGIRRFRRQ